MITACGTKENPLNKELDFHDVSAKNGVNRMTSEMRQTEETRKGNEIVVALLNEAINLQQSDHIAASREKLQGSEIVMAISGTAMSTMIVSFAFFSELQ